MEECCCRCCCCHISLRFCCHCPPPEVNRRDSDEHGRLIVPIQPEPQAQPHGQLQRVHVSIEPEIASTTGKPSQQKSVPVPIDTPPRGKSLPKGSMLNFPTPYRKSPSVISVASGLPADNKPVYGVAKYSFNIESVHHPEDATSNYTGNDPKDEALAIIRHYKDAVKACKKIQADLTACWRQLNLKGPAEFSACFIAISAKGGSYKFFSSEHGYPPRIALAPNVPQKVKEACNKLNSAIATSFNFAVSRLDDLEQTEKNLATVKSNQHSPYMESSVFILEDQKRYIDCLMNQSDMFLHDFSVYAPRFSSIS